MDSTAIAGGTSPEKFIHNQMFRHNFLRSLVILILTWIGWAVFSFPVRAEMADPYVLRYLADEPVEIVRDQKGQTQTFSPAALSEGKDLFANNCLSCHTGGRTAQYPTVSLSLEALKGASPPRDNIAGLVAYMRHPVSYDGSDTNYWCREVTERWMSESEIENLAAFLLRAAETAPNWGE